MGYCTWCNREHAEGFMFSKATCVYCQPAIEAIDIIHKMSPKVLDACRLLLRHDWMRAEVNESWKLQLRQLRRSLLEYIDAGEDI